MTVTKTCWFGGTFLAVALLFVCTPANADLVGLWRFDAKADPQPDSSSFGNDASVFDATWVNDEERGGAMEFFGLDGAPESWLEVEDSDSLSIEDTGLTIAAWANFADFDNWNSIVAKTGESSTNKPSPYDVYTQRGGDGRAQLFVGEGNGEIQATNPIDPPEVEEWQHIAITLTEEGDVVHYLNGEENGEDFIDRELIFLTDEDQPLFIGSRLDGTTNMRGLLDDVAIFNHALSEKEVTTILAGDFSLYLGGLAGDYNDDGAVDDQDIDAQSAEMKKPDPNLEVFDENDDGKVDNEDRSIWVKQHAVDGNGTWFGDANLEGEFNSSDLVAVFSAGKYETNEMAGWAEGDWNGDMSFNSGDLVVAFADGGYENGPLPGQALVPEPSALALLSLGWLLTALRRRAH